MNEYLLKIYEERKARAEACKERLLAVHAEILRKSSASVGGGEPYLMAERRADTAALQTAMAEMGEALQAIQEIEEAERGR